MPSSHYRHQRDRPNETRATCPRLDRACVRLLLVTLVLLVKKHDAFLTSAVLRHDHRCSGSGGSGGSGWCTTTRPAASADLGSSEVRKAVLLLRSCRDAFGEAVCKAMGCMTQTLWETDTYEYHDPA